MCALGRIEDEQDIAFVLGYPDIGDQDLNGMCLVVFDHNLLSCCHRHKDSSRKKRNIGVSYALHGLQLKRGGPIFFGQICKEERSCILIWYVLKFLHSSRERVTETMRPCRKDGF